jgi:hypothetical protein
MKLYVKNIFKNEKNEDARRKRREGDICVTALKEHA